MTRVIRTDSRNVTRGLWYDQEASVKTSPKVVERTDARREESIDGGGLGVWETDVGR